MSGLAWMSVVIAAVLCAWLLVGLWLSQRRAWQLCQRQESPLIYASFDMVPGLQAEDVQILRRPGPWARHLFWITVPDRETWYCHAPGMGFFSVRADYGRTWWGWRVRWSVQHLDEKALREALAGDHWASRLAFGQLMDNRLYA